MATLEQEVKRREELKAVLDELIAIKPEALVRGDVLGKDLSFESGLPVFRRALNLFRDLGECNLDDVPFEKLNELHGQASQALQHFREIQQFSLQKHPTNPTQARDQLIRSIQDSWSSYYTYLTPLIAYATRKGSDLDSLEREARGTLTLVKQIEGELKSGSEKILIDMRGALEKVRQAAAEAGVAQHAIHFKTEADSYLKQSYIWLGAAVVMGIATGWYALQSLGVQLHDLAAKAPTPQIIVAGIAKLIFLSLLSSGVVFCIRNYAASRHNFVVNRHRQNALSTFEAFVKAAREDEIRDAVLVRATQSIFAPQTSGYLKGIGDQPSPGQVFDSVRHLVGKKE